MICYVTLHINRNALIVYFFQDMLRFNYCTYRLIICSTLSTVCSTKQMQIMHILTTRLPWIWNLTNSFEVFETTGRIAYFDKWPTQNLTISVFRVVYFLELLVINTFKRRDSPIRWIRLLLSLGQLPHVGGYIRCI